LPRCSPDGRSLLFRRGGAERGELVHLDLETLQERRLTNDTVRDSNPQWSRDGRTIFATKRIAGFDRIISLDLEGVQLRVLSPERDWHDVMPAVSPDGRSLVFHTYRYGKEADLELLELDAMTSRRLTDSPGHDYEASFVGSDAVVFSSNRDGGHYRIYRVSLSGPASVRLLADTGRDAWGPRYSAASGEVLFYTGRPGAWRLMLVGADGGPARPFLEDGTSKSTADWCPLPDSAQGVPGVSALSEVRSRLPRRGHTQFQNSDESVVFGTRLSESKRGVASFLGVRFEINP
jgi:Tol biopolymer transport system component